MALAPPASGYHVIPLEPKDQWKPIDNIRSISFFVIRHQIDEPLLRDALERLIRDHLQILGAPLRPFEKSKRLAYHLPATFSHETPLFEWSTRWLPLTLRTSQLPSGPTENSTGDTITWGPSIVQLEKEWTPANWPRERCHDRADTPTLLIHLTHYQDAAVVSVNLPHAVVDQLGFGSFIRAWMQLAGGKDPLPFRQLRQGALDGTDSLPETALRQKGQYRIMTMKERVKTVLQFVPELAKQPDEARRVMIIPVAFVTKLREKHQAQINSQAILDHAELSNGDIIVALLLKLGHLHRKTPKMVTLSGAVNARGRHPELQGKDPYLHNALVQSVTRMLVSRETPLFEIARQNRLAITEAIKPENIDRSFAVTKETFRRGHSHHICEPGDLSMSVTNWSSAWHGIDFSAVRTERLGEKSTTSNFMGLHRPLAGDSQGTPLVLGHALVRGKPTRYNAQIMCKAEGGYWCDFTTSSKNMVLVDALLERDPSLDTL